MQLLIKIASIVCVASALQISRGDEDGFHIIDADDATMDTENGHLEENTPGGAHNPLHSSGHSLSPAPSRTSSQGSERLTLTSIFLKIFLKT